MERNCLHLTGKGRILYTHHLVLLFSGTLEEVATCLNKDVSREFCDANRNKKKTICEKKRKETHATPRKGKVLNAQQAAIWTEDRVVRTRSVLIAVYQEAYG